MKSLSGLVSLLLLVSLLVLQLVGFSRGANCVQSLHVCLDENANDAGPTFRPLDNLTLYERQTYEHTFYSLCQIIVYIDYCENSKYVYSTKESEDQNGTTIHSLTIRFFNLSPSDIGKRIDMSFAWPCNISSCARPFFITDVISGLPPTPDELTINFTNCTTLTISGKWPVNTTSLNIQLLEWDRLAPLSNHSTLSLPWSINVTGVDQHREVILTGINPNGEGTPFNYIPHYINLTSKIIKVDENVEIVSDKPVVHFIIKIDIQCEPYQPLYINSFCLSQEYINKNGLYNESETQNISINVSNYTIGENCTFTIVYGGEEQILNISIDPVQKATLNVTESGSYTVECVLLPGAPGCVVEVNRTNGSYVFHYLVLRNDTTNNTIISYSSNRTLTDGHYIFSAYTLMSDHSYDRNYVLAQVSKIIINKENNNSTNTNNTHDNNNNNNNNNTNDNNNNNNNTNRDKDKKGHKILTIGIGTSLPLSLVIVVIVMGIGIVVALFGRSRRNYRPDNNGVGRIELQGYTCRQGQVDDKIEEGEHKGEHEGEHREEERNRKEHEGEKERNTEEHEEHGEEADTQRHKNIEVSGVHVAQSNIEGDEESLKLTEERVNQKLPETETKAAPVKETTTNTWTTDRSDVPFLPPSSDVILYEEPNYQATENNQELSYESFQVGTVNKSTEVQDNQGTSTTLCPDHPKSKLPSEDHSKTIVLGTSTPGPNSDSQFVFS